ncbi:hypothetical protein OJAV_G00084820 [Oryzias javanicus]|uniref:Uncharacterized protein n=1 Tax=Oryzias javanicus TaxID=123683 RepID=A0A3S2P6D8_ORYJA|nr:hypothetical protein OJAV_G00084820 [Oryzias javanicus]
MSVSDVPLTSPQPPGQQSSGLLRNRSPINSQLSPDLQHPEPRPPRDDGTSDWKEDEDVEKEMHAPPEPGSDKDLKEKLSTPSVIIFKETEPRGRRPSEDTPPPCSPSRVRWLKAYNRVREKLLQVGG